MMSSGEKPCFAAKFESSLDSAMDKIGLFDLVATKGFHFPQGSYVLYKGEIPIEERGRVAQDLNQELAAMIKQGFEIEYRLVSIDELADLIEEVPNYLPKNKPIRVVKVWEDKWIPCGGVHTNSLKNLREIEVTKIKTKKGDIKVSYKII